MNAIFQEVSVATTSDFEFGVNKRRACTYRIYNQQYTGGLVVYIPGFGADLGKYTEIFCQKISEQYKVACLSVEYFCIHCRPEIGAEIEFEPEDIDKIAAVLKQSQGTTYLERLINYTETAQIALTATASLKPAKGEYQNFGILAALDLINCLKDAVGRFALNKNNIILIGSSYGGYLANLVTKIYPGLIRAVFDNSSWANPNLWYVAGRELNTPEFIFRRSEKLTLHLFVKSPWTLKEGLPNSFTREKAAIRSFTQDQVQQMAVQGGLDTFYVFYHSIIDSIAPTNEKVEMVKSLVLHKFKHVYMEVMEQQDVDGSFVKSLDHGMGLSMITFFDRAFTHLEQSGIAFQAGEEKERIDYLCEQATYSFYLQETPVRGVLDYNG